LPAKLRNRIADNWRVLISIADSFGPAWGKRARDAAMTFARGFHGEDAGVIPLGDIRTVFNGHNADRFTSGALVKALINLDDGTWADWRGMRDDQQPHKLTQPELARLLRPFHIRPKTVWPPGGRRDRGPSSRGYSRDQFESAWAKYCDENDTPPHPTSVKAKLAGRA
jgi:Protein of unknown function (DUF3631)